jgi:hypothetical protein
MGGHQHEGNVMHDPDEQDRLMEPKPREEYIGRNISPADPVQRAEVLLAHVTDALVKATEAAEGLWRVIEHAKAERAKSDTARGQRLADALAPRSAEPDMGTLLAPAIAAAQTQTIKRRV